MVDFQQALRTIDNFIITNGVRFVINRQGENIQVSKDNDPAKEQPKDLGGIGFLEGMTENGKNAIIHFKARQPYVPQKDDIVFIKDVEYTIENVDEQGTGNGIVGYYEVKAVA